MNPRKRDSLPEPVWLADTVPQPPKGAQQRGPRPKKLIRSAATQAVAFYGNDIDMLFTASEGLSRPRSTAQRAPRADVATLSAFARSLPLGQQHADCADYMANALSVTQIKALTAVEVLYHFQRVHRVFKVNLDDPRPQLPRLPSGRGLQLCGRHHREQGLGEAVAAAQPLSHLAWNPHHGAGAGARGLQGQEPLRLQGQHGVYQPAAVPEPARAPEADVACLHSSASASREADAERSRAPAAAGKDAHQHAQGPPPPSASCNRPLPALGLRWQVASGRKDEIGLIQAKDPLLEPRGSSVHGVGKAAGLAIPDLIALEDARWLDIKLLAEVASPAIVVQGAVGRALRSFISRFDKEVVTRLGRNSLVGRLLKEGVGEFQISTLMKWNIGHTMQATYATRDPASVLPAFITAAGFPAGAGVRYSIPRASVVVEAVAPTLHSKLFPAAALMYSLEEEKVGLQAAIQEAKDKAESEQLWRQYQLADGAIKAYKALASCSLVQQQALDWMLLAAPPNARIQASVPSYSICGRSTLRPPLLKAKPTLRAGNGPMIVQAGLFAPKVAPPPPQDPFYNRVTELDYFTEKFSGEVGFVTVLVGPRNCGKSRLLKELLRQYEQQNIGPLFLYINSRKTPVCSPDEVSKALVNEANDLMDWKEPDPLQPELKQLLSFLVSISKEDRLAHVILATSDYFLANWLTQVGMTEDKFEVEVLGDLTEEEAEKFMYGDGVAGGWRGIVNDSFKTKEDLANAKDQWSEMYQRCGGNIGLLKQCVAAARNLKGNWDSALQAVVAGPVGAVTRGFKPSVYIQKGGEDPLWTKGQWRMVLERITTAPQHAVLASEIEEELGESGEDILLSMVKYNLLALRPPSTLARDLPQDVYGSGKK
ncbi:hypothetical protein KSW81_000002 [Nannochloris sp. 'desiccata']|nr:hypothetical protein KSW81_000002 [Chlorella desiccata (nom. nud.)]